MLEVKDQPAASVPRTPEGTRTTEPKHAEDAVRAILSRAYSGEAAWGQDTFIRDGMYVAELARMYSALREHGCRSALEVGMACGTSSVVISQAIAENGGGTLVSVDPFQNKTYGGKGLQALKTAGLDAGHRLVEELDYLALPRLVAEGLRCDFAFLDGWHSFDYTFIDLFYADLLLNDGGIMMLHDSVMPCVHKACMFLEGHKPYKRLSAPVLPRIDSLVGRGMRRLGTMFSGPEAMREMKSRREEWLALAAYQKVATQQVPEDHPVAF